MTSAAAPDPNGLSDWLYLLHQLGLTLAEKRRLIETLDGVDRIGRASAGELNHLLGRARPGRHLIPVDPALIEADIETMARLNMQFIPFTSPDFPQKLNAISSGPLGLFVRGAAALLGAGQITMVGSRSPSPAGRRTAEQFAGRLAAQGFVITSGLASGIDGAAHRGCLNAGGRTIAVVANGLDLIYPPRHRELAEQVAAQGALVSEYPPGTKPLRRHFPARNRLLAGLSLGTLVVEAGLKSGSLITARFAVEADREVFAIPGPIHLPTSRGCHRLIREGALLIETPEDILEALGWLPTAEKPTREKTPLEGSLAALMRHIDYVPTPVDDLIEQSGLTADEVSYILTTLEMEGHIANTPNGYQRLPD